MEIYKELNNPLSKEFEQLLNTELSKVKIEEGKIITGTVTKISEKYIFLFVDGLKSEAVLDINELRQLGLSDKIELNATIPVLLEKIEDKSGNVLVSASKALKLKGWENLVEKFEKDEPINGKITGRVKGGAIVQHIETGTLMFLPGSQISSSPVKNIDHLINEVQKFKIIKLDRVRGNICCSRREILDAGKKQDKAEVIKKYPVGTIIKSAKVKNLSSFGAFCSVNDELDVLVHTSELSYSRVNHPDELYSIGDITDLIVIQIDEQKLQVGCSIKQLSPDPFEKIDKYELNKIYKFKVIKIAEFGAFCELVELPGLSALLHSSELSWTKKNLSAKKMFTVGQEIDCKITEIDKDKRRVAISYKLTQDNPFEVFEKKYPVGTIVEGEVVNKNEYSLFVKVEDTNIDAFLHCNDLTYLNNSEEELNKYKKNDKVKVKVLEIKTSEQKIRVGLKQTLSDPYDWFKDKTITTKISEAITVKIISSDNKGLIVRPIGCDMDFNIKKSQIAINAQDSRQSRFSGGEKVDCAISELDLDKRKITLSMKLLEEIEKKEVLDKYGSEGSGKNLPFSSLSDDLKKKEKNKE